MTLAQFSVFPKINPICEKGSSPNTRNLEDFLVRLRKVVEDQVDLKRGLLILHRVRRIPASADGGSLVQLSGFRGFPVFVCCQVLGNAAKPGEFAGTFAQRSFWRS